MSADARTLTVALWDEGHLMPLQHEGKNNLLTPSLSISYSSKWFFLSLSTKLFSQCVLSLSFLQPQRNHLCLSLCVAYFITLYSSSSLTTLLMDHTHTHLPSNVPQFIPLSLSLSHFQASSPFIPSSSLNTISLALSPSLSLTQVIPFSTLSHSIFFLIFSLNLSRYLLHPLCL